MFPKNKHIWLIILSFLLTVSAIQAQNWKKVDPDEKELEKRYRMAIHLENTGRKEEALKVYKYIYEQAPEKQKYLQRYLRLLFQMEKFDSMRQILQKHLDNNPQDLDSWLNLGVAYYQQGEKKKAFQHWNKVLEQFGHSQKVYRKLFIQYLRLQEYEKGQELVENLRQRENDKNLMALEMGELYTGQGQYKKALEEYLKYAQSHKNYDYVMRRILRFPDEPHVLTDIEPFLNKQIPSDSRNVKLLEIKEKIYFKYKNFDRASQIAFQIEKSSGYSGKHIKNFTHNLVSEKKYDLAEKNYYRIMKNDKFQSIHHQALLGLADIAEKKIENQKTNLFNYFYPDNYFFNSYYYYGIEKDLVYLEEAFSIYDSLLTQSHNHRFSAKVNFRLGKLSLLATRDFDSALKFFRSAYNQSEKYPFRIQCAQRLAQTFLALGELDQASQEINKLYSRLNTRYQQKLLPDRLLIELYTENPKIDSLANQALGELGFQNDYYNDVFELYSFLEKYREAKGFDDFIRAEIKLKQDQLGRARSIYQYILDSYQSSIREPALFRSVQMQLYFDNYQKAEVLVEKMDSTSIYRSDAIFMLAEIAGDRKNDAEMASKWYQELVISYPQDINVDKARRRLRQLSQKK
ncbi:MAG: tetratricopeptide repeat protein [Candidatus Marinimicrobia bacterium]|nr:tetratricopeptide repeat protein [Candidatus Neomarinimicrobiota bacterium]